VNGAPSWNLTPWRKWKRQLVSLMRSQLVASPGTSCMSGPTLTSGSSTLCMMLRVDTSPVDIGSRLAMSD